MKQPVAFFHSFCALQEMHHWLRANGKTTTKIEWVCEPIFSLVKIVNLPDLLMSSLMSIFTVISNK